MEIEEMTINLRSSWLQNKFSLSVFQKGMKNSMENTPTDVRV